MSAFCSTAGALLAPFNRTLDERRPSSLLLGLEVRSLMELASIPWALPWLLRNVPHGDGHPVLVLPGLLASDASTVPLRSFLRNRGYDVHGWRQGRNLGPRPGVWEKLHASLAALHDRSGGRAVSLVGWSLGGIYAREIARAQPALVRQVVTLGSPLYGAPESSTNAWHVYRAVSANHEVHAHERGSEAPPVPTTSIYTRGDGVVGWGCSVERQGERTDNIEINSASHIGLGVNPLVWFALGDRLAQPEGQWKHFSPRGLRRLLLPFKAPARV